MKVTTIQHNIKWENKKLNISEYNQYINNIQQTDLIILPEMFNTGFTMKPEMNFETMNGETINWMKNIANNKNCAITGSLIIKENNNYYNRLIWCQPNNIIQHYDKKHLFPIAEENKHYQNGNKILIIDYKGFKIKPLICYDLRFPTWSRIGNFDILIYVANWPMSRKNAWTTLLKARSIENQCYTIGVNRIGTDTTGLQHSGDTMIINPNGDIINSISSEGTITTELDLDTINNIRDKFPFLNDKDDFILNSK